MPLSVSQLRTSPERSTAATCAGGGGRERRTDGDDTAEAVAEGDCGREGVGNGSGDSDDGDGDIDERPNTSGNRELREDDRELTGDSEPSL
jgi:hypothetical protein